LFFILFYLPRLFCSKEREKLTLSLSLSLSLFLPSSKTPNPKITGNLWALWADSTGRHGPILLFAYCSCGLLRYSLRFVKGFPQTLGVVLLMEALGSPVNIIADAAVIASGKEEGDYGRTRLFGAVGWGLCSPVGGWLVQKKGLGAGFVANGVGWGSGLLLTLMLPVGVLSSSSSKEEKEKEKERKKKKGEEGLSSEAAASALAADSATASSSCPPPPLESGAEGGGIAGSRRRLASGGWEEEQNEDGEREEEGEGGEERGGETSSSSSEEEDEEEAAAAVAEAAAREAPLAPAAELVAFDGHALAYHSHHHKRKKKKKEKKRRQNQRSLSSDVEEPLLAEEEEDEIRGNTGDDGNETSSTSSSSSSDDDDTNNNESLPLTKKLAAVFSSSPRAATFFATATLFGFAMGTIDTWLFVFLDEALGAKEALMGATLTVTCIVEAPVFYASGHLIRSLGVPRILHMVHAAFLLRLACYWLLPWLVTVKNFSPWVVLFVEPLHGITFGCAWAAGCAQAARLAPPGLSATTQALFSGLYLGAGSGLGALVGGAVHARFSREGQGGSGGRAVFAVAGGVVAVGWALSTLAGLFMGPPLPSSSSSSSRSSRSASREVD